MLTRTLAIEKHIHTCRRFHDLGQTVLAGQEWNNRPDRINIFPISVLSIDNSLPPLNNFLQN